MEIRFRTRKLERWYVDGSAAQRALGRPLAERYVERIHIMKATKNIEELAALPALHCHPLTGDRRGQWAVSLNGQVRLIFRLLEDERTIRIEEVTDYHEG